jgi:plastocyanin
VAADDVNGPFSGAEITVTTTDPVWAFCRQSTHCQQGMVFAINPGKKFQAFKANAMGGTSTGTTTASSSATVFSSSAVKSSSSVVSKSHTYTPSPTTLTVEATTFTLDLPTTSVPDSIITFSFGDIIPSSSSTSHSALPTAISSSTDHWVTVGANSQLSFNPTNITANVGDTVTFEIRPKNHTVTASSFAAPCTPLSETNTSASEIFDSGFMAVSTGNFPTYTIQVNTTEPLWIFSAQPGECAQGMVFAVNAPNDDYAVFESKAMATNGSELAMNGKNAASMSASMGAGTLSASLAMCALLSILISS